MLEYILVFQKYRDRKTIGQRVGDKNGTVNRIENQKILI